MSDAAFQKLAKGLWYGMVFLAGAYIGFFGGCYVGTVETRRKYDCFRQGWESVAKRHREEDAVFRRLESIVEGARPSQQSIPIPASSIREIKPGDPDWEEFAK